MPLSSAGLRAALGVVGLALGILLLVFPGQLVCSPGVVLQEPDVVVCSHASTVAAGDPRRGAIYRSETAYSPLMRVCGAVHAAETTTPPGQQEALRSGAH